jgi:hypothetical protein
MAHHLTAHAAAAAAMVVLLASGLTACSDRVNADARTAAAKARSAAAMAGASNRKLISDAAITTSANAEWARDRQRTAREVDADRQGGDGGDGGGVKSVDNRPTAR